MKKRPSRPEKQPARVAPEALRDVRGGGMFDIELPDLSSGGWTYTGGGVTDEDNWAENT